MDGYRVKIAGTTYFLTGVEDHDYMDRLAAAVDERIRAIREANSTVNMTEAVTLAMLNFMHEYFQQKERCDAALKALSHSDPKVAGRLLNEPLFKETSPSTGDQQKTAQDTYSSNSKTVLQEAADRGLMGKKQAPAKTVQKPVTERAESFTKDSLEEPVPAYSEADRLNADVYAPVRQRKQRSLSIDPLTGEPRPSSFNKKAAKETGSNGLPVDSEEANRSAAPAKRSEGYSIDPITGKARKVVKKSRPTRIEEEKKSVQPKPERTSRVGQVAEAPTKNDRPAGKPKGKSLNPFG